MSEEKVSLTFNASKFTVQCTSCDRILIESALRGLHAIPACQCGLKGIMAAIRKACIAIDCNGGKSPACPFCGWAVKAAQKAFDEASTK